jgi:type VII secretion-associated serine protease mycosin
MIRRRSRAVLALVAVVGVLLPSTPAYADNVRDAQWHLGFLNIAEAQRLGDNGAGVTVAVVDSGVDASHPDLAGNVFPGTDLVNPGADGRLDRNGHGTAMAGLIAAHGHGNAAGALGIAPKAQLLPVRVTDLGSAIGGRDIDGIAWAAQHGVKVMCVALGGYDQPKMRQAVQQALAADIVVVAAVGNRPVDKDVMYPAAYPGVIAAAGADRQGNHAEVSVTGPQVVLTAPGVDIVSSEPNNKYSKGVGTSGATAIIAGVAALVRAKYPNLSAAEVVHRLTATATDKGPAGRDDQYGYGIVNPVAALTTDVPPLKPSATPGAAPTTNDAVPVVTPPAVAQPSRPNRTRLVIALVVAGLLVVAATATAITLAAVRSRR